MERQSIYGWEHSMLLRYQLFLSWYIDLTQSQTKFQQDFRETHKLILKFILRFRGPRVAKTTLKTKNNIGKLTLLLQVVPLS